MTNELEKAVEYIKKRIEWMPEIAIILGSGLGSFADNLTKAVKLPTSQIPEYPVSTVAGHKGHLVFGSWNGVKVMAVQGRTHYYEGYGSEKVTFIVRIMGALGIKTLIVTNAAGGVNPRFAPGDLMLITDQINGMFANPLAGPLKYGGERFPNMNEAYSSHLFPIADEVALECGIKLQHGVLYVSTGPSYETAAEIKMISKLGGDAASMSTAPEVIVANHEGMNVLGISCITNMATGISKQPLSHTEVTETANLVHQKFVKLVSGIIERIARSG